MATWVFLSLTMLTGCAQTPPAEKSASSSTKLAAAAETAPPGTRIHNGDFQYAEYWGNEHGIDVHVVILPAGGARVDLRRPDQPVKTIIVPVSPAEADRLARVVSALDQSMFDYQPGMIMTTLFRSRSLNGERTIRVGPRPRKHSHVVAGLADEFCEIGFVDVAVAIEAADYAQELMAQGDNRFAIYQAAIAIDTLDAWWMRYPLRYDDWNVDLFKDEHSFPEIQTRPVTLTDEEYRHAEERLKAGGEPAKTIADVAVKSFRDELSLYFSVRREAGNITSITPPKDRDRWIDMGKAGIASSTPPEALKILRDPRWLELPTK